MSWLERWRGLYWDPPGNLGLLFVLLAGAVVVYSVYLYRRNDAPLSPGLRTVLAGLRAVALLLLVVILCRPVLSLAVPGGAARGVLVLLDGSESMGLPGRTPLESRNDERIRAAEAIRNELDSSYPLVFRTFDGSLGPPLESLPPPEPRGEATDLARALEQGVVEGGPQGRPGAMILVSDGAQTQGPDPVPPARRLGIPIETVALGVQEAVPDLALTRVRVNREAFSGEKTPLEAVLRLQGLPAVTVSVRLYDVTDDEVELDATTVRLDAEGAEQRVGLSFVPTQTGLRFLELRVSGQQNESTLANNRRLVAIQVREEKTGILLLSGALTWDHTFLRRALDADSTLEVTAGYWRGGKFRPVSGGGSIPDLDATGLRPMRVVILDHVTASQLVPREQEALAGFTRSGGGLLVVTGGREGGISSWRGSPLETLLPVQVGVRAGDAERQTRITPQGRRHVVFDPSVPGAPPLEVWTDLPPLVIAADLGVGRAGAEPLLVATGGANEPVLSWARGGQGRVVALAAGGVWKWDFTSAAHGPAGNVMPGWWRRLVHWLARPGLETRLDIHPEEYVVPRGRPVSFVGRVTDEAYQPLPGVEVMVEILPAAGSEEPPRTISLSGAEGFHSGLAEALSPGRYRYLGRARSGGEAMGTVEGVFVVDSLGTEMERLEADHELLERIAAATGGRLWSPDSLEDLSVSLSSFAEAEEERIQLALWDHPVLFVLFVLAASLEWFLRRRRGLV